MPMPAAPKMQNDSTVYMKVRVHMTTCLVVRPREMSTINVVTNEAQTIRQPPEKKTHKSIQESLPPLTSFGSPFLRAMWPKVSVSKTMSPKWLWFIW